MTNPVEPSPDHPSRLFSRAGTVVRVLCRGLLESLPGQLLMLVIGFIAMGLVLVYFPAATSFRLQWMTDRAETAHLAGMAADVAEGGALGEDEMRQLLTSADAVAVSRVREGMNELLLYSGPIGEDIVESDLRTTGWLMHVRDTTETLFAPPGRMLRIRAEPDGYPGEVIDVILPEAPLKAELAAFSRRLLIYSVLVAAAVGLIVYLALFYLFVRPMRRLADAMIRFRADPEDPARTVSPSGANNEIGQAEAELALMQDDIRQALRQRERLAALGSAVAKINHDLRNILTSAQLVSDRLAMDEDTRIRSMGQRLVRAVDRGVRLCEETLKYGRAGEVAPSPVAVLGADLLDDAAGDAMLSEGEVVWENTVDPDTVWLVDPDQAHRIFLNLFRNAIQAMKAQETPGRLEVIARSDGEFASIEVRDNGPGLPDKARDRLFEAFTGSTRKGGTGLGLSIARELARGHGGDIALLTSDGSGTVFAVRLPLGVSEV